MSLLNVFPGLIASACVVGAAMPAALAASVEMAPEPAAQTSIHLAQQDTTSGLMTDDLESQPESPDDLGIDSLTDEQVAQLIAVFEAYQPQIDDATANYLMALSVLNDLLVPSTADLALTDAHNGVLSSRQTLDALLFQRNLGLRSVLTLDQRQVINDVVRDYLGIAPAEPVAVFPMNLVGQDIATTLPSLQADGWVLVVETPGYRGFNRGSERLDLDLGRRGEILGARLN